MAQQNKNKPKTPKTLEVTARCRFLGEAIDPETEQKVIIEDGEDVELSYRLAMRLSVGDQPKVAIDKEDRKEAKKIAKARAEQRDKRDKLEAGRIAMIEGSLLGPVA